MLTYEKLVGNSRCFRTIVGMTLAEFDLLVATVEKLYPDAERKRLSDRPRKRAIGAGRRFSLDVRKKVLLLLVYYRGYMSQDLAAVLFGIGQASVSRSITQMEPILKQCIPIPARIHDEMKKSTTLADLEENIPGLFALIDAGEQEIQRPTRKDMEKSHYSGKAGRHTAKVQYTINSKGRIIHNSRHSPGRKHDVKVYKTKHPTFPDPKSLKGAAEDTADRVDLYADRGYQGGQDAYENVKLCTPIKKKPKQKLSDLEKEYNRVHSALRIHVEHAIRRVKTWRIMGNRYRNRLKKYDLINDIVCGLVNHHLLWLAG